MKKLFGLGGLARSGKDTFCTIATKILENKGYSVKKFSFANALKKEVAPFLNEKCGVDVWSDDSELKADFRDFLVWYGTTWWRKRDPNRWIRLVDIELNKQKNDFDIAFVTDVRYPNEAEWVHSRQGFFYHIASYNLIENTNPIYSKYSKVFKNPPNEQEKINDPLIKQIANYRVEWESKDLTPEEVLKNEELNSIVLQAINSCDFFNDVVML